MGLGPASTTTTYARGAIAFVAEKLEEDFEMEQAERWRRLCQKITKEYELGRETQLIAIRGVRIIRHKAAIGMNEIQMFLIHGSNKSENQKEKTNSTLNSQPHPRHSTPKG